MDQTVTGWCISDCNTCLAFDAGAGAGGTSDGPQKCHRAAAKLLLFQLISARLPMIGSFLVDIATT